MPCFENGSSPEASDLLDAYAAVLESASLTFNVSPEGNISLDQAGKTEELVNLQVSDNGTGEADFTIDEEAVVAATIDLAGTIAKIEDTFDAEDGLRKLVEGIAGELRNTIAPGRGRPVPLVRFKSANGDNDSGGVAQLLGVWLASDEQLEVLRSGGDSGAIIFEEAEMEGRGLREAAAALAILGVVVGGTVSTAEANLFRRQSKAAAQSQKVSKETGQAPARVDQRALAKVQASTTTVVVDIEDQRAYLIADGKIVIDTPVSTARSGKYTPRGNFKITQRVRTGKAINDLRVCVALLDAPGSIRDRFTRR